MWRLVSQGYQLPVLRCVKGPSGPDQTALTNCLYQRDNTLNLRMLADSPAARTIPAMPSDSQLTEPSSVIVA